MTSTQLEKLRQRFQDIEEYRAKAVKLMLNEAKTVKEDVYITHHVASYAKEIQNSSREILATLSEGIPRSDDPLTDFYADLERRIQFHQQVADATNTKTEVKEEEAPVEESSMNDLIFDIRGTAHLSLFYDNDRFQEWKRQQKQHGDKKKTKKRHIVVPDNDEALKKFNGEECYGQFLDLIEHHRFLSTFMPSNGPGYIEWLEMLCDTDFSFLPRNSQSEKFLEKIIDYFSSFVERSQPFFDLDGYKEGIQREFNGMIPRATPTSHPEFYCGYCDRSFDSGELLESHYKQKSHSKNLARAEKCGGLDQLMEQRRLAGYKHDELRFTAQSFIRLLQDKLRATIENCKRRLTLSAAVMQAEQNLDAPIVFDETEDEDEEQFYNPKGLPLGWDGKPIPYWLYKLHGLSVEYKCEICGNRSYWGALAFERHFFDSRHINGLKALGIPPTRHFVYVTGVNEAIILFDKIKKSLTKEVWQPGDEEIETEDGQVMSMKIYQDLVRQGLIKPKH